MIVKNHSRYFVKRSYFCFSLGLHNGNDKEDIDRIPKIVRILAYSSINQIYVTIN
jgi:hypothetical protein